MREITYTGTPVVTPVGKLAAATLAVSTDDFDGILGENDDQVQAALETIDDHTHAQYAGGVKTSPAATADNTIVPTGAAVVPLTLKAVTGQTANLHELQDKDGNVMASVSPLGAWTFLRHVSAETAVLDAQRGDVVSYIEDICTSNLKGLWVFNSRAGTTVADRKTSGTANTLTLSSDASTWVAQWVGACPFLLQPSSPGTDYWSVADSDDFSFGNGSTDSPFSIFGLFYLPSGSNASNFLVNKYNEQTDSEEWGWILNSSSQTRFRIFDASTSPLAYKGRLAAGTTLAAATWYTGTVTYDGSATSAGIKIYLNGVRIDDTDSEANSYTAMENGSAEVACYQTDSGGTRQGVKRTRWGVLGITGQELSAAEVARISRRLRGYAGQL